MGGEVGEVGEVAFVVKAIYKAGVCIVVSSLSSVCGVSGYVCKIVGDCICMLEFINFRRGEVLVIDVVAYEGNITIKVATHEYFCGWKFM